MLIKIGYENMVFVDLTEEQEKDVEKNAGKTVVIYQAANGLGVKGSKEDMFDLICKLSYKYDLEVN